MVNKGFILFSSLIFFIFIMGVLLSSIFSTLGLTIMIGCVILEAMGFYIFTNSQKKPLWNNKILKKSIVAHCDGIIESIEIIHGYEKFSQDHYKITISNMAPQSPTRVSPAEGSIKITSYIHDDMKKPYQLKAIISTHNSHVIICDNSWEHHAGFINIIANKSLLNDVTELFCFDNTVKNNDLLWSMYITSKSQIIFPVNQWSLKIVEGQTLIHGETIMASFINSIKNTNPMDGS